MSTPCIAAATWRGSFGSTPPALHRLEAAFRQWTQGHARPGSLSANKTRDGSMPLEPALASLWSSRQPLSPGRARWLGIAYVVSTASHVSPQASGDMTVLQDTRTAAHAH